MKEGYTEEQIIGFIKEAEAGTPFKELCHRHGFSEGELLHVAEQVRRHGRHGRQAAERARGREQSLEAAVGRVDARKRSHALAVISQ